MGSLFGSIHIRSADRDALFAALAGVPDSAFYVAAERNGWTAVYPSERGQDVQVTHQMAAHVRAAMVHIIVHDSDVFNYAVFRDGTLIDEYSSVPDYFGPVDELVRARLRGHPGRFADLFTPGHSVADVRKLLDQRRAGVAAREPLDVDAELRNVDRDVARMKTSPELRDAKRELREGTAALIPALKDAPEEQLVVALVQHADPEAKRVLDTYQRALLDIMQRFTSSKAGADLIARETNGSSAENAAAGFAHALGLEDALTSYEDLAPGSTLTHIGSER